jgi:integrase
MTDSKGGWPPLPLGVKRKIGANGKPYYYLSDNTRVHADLGTPEWPAALKAAMRKPAAPPPRTDTLPRLIDEWKASPEFLRGAPGTQTVRKTALRKIERWFKKSLIKDFNDRTIRRHIYAFRNSMAKTPAMADTSIDTLCLMLNWAYDQGAEIEVNHALRIGRLYSGTRSEIVWTDDQRLTFWAEAEPAVARAHQALFYSAARIIDAAAWRPESYDGRWLVFTPQKTARRTKIEVHLPVYVLPPFQALLDAGGLPLLTKTGKPWTASSLSDQLASERRRIFGEALDLHSHDLRGTIATKLVDAGCNDREVSAITGHGTPEAAADRGRSLSIYVKRTREQAVNAYTKWWAAELAPRGEVVQFPERA